MRESAPLCESIDSGAGRVGLCFPGGATAPQHWIGFTISLLPLPPAQIPPQFTNSRGVRKTANPTWAQVQALRRRAPPFGAAAGGHAVGCSRGLYPSATPRGWHIAGDAEPQATRAGTATVGLVASAHRAGRRAKELRREEQRAATDAARRPGGGPLAAGRRIAIGTALLRRCPIIPDVPRANREPCIHHARFLQSFAHERFCRHSFASFFMCVWCRYVSPELNPEELPPDYMALASVVLGIVGLMLKVCTALVCPVGAGMPWC